MPRAGPFATKLLKTTSPASFSLGGKKGGPPKKPLAGSGTASPIRIVWAAPVGGCQTSASLVVAPSMLALKVMAPAVSTAGAEVAESYVPPAGVGLGVGPPSVT